MRQSARLVLAVCVMLAGPAPARGQSQAPVAGGEEPASIQLTAPGAGMSAPVAGKWGVAQWREQAPSLDGPVPFYYLCLGILSLSLFAALNLLRSPTGRAFIAVRDSEVSAESMGINLARTKCTAFAISAAFTGLAGTLFSHRIGYLAPDAFTVQTSIQLLLMVVVGGLGSLQGVVYGAIFLGLLPQAIAIGRDVLPQWIGEIPGLEPGIPRGSAGRLAEAGPQHPGHSHERHDAHAPAGSGPVSVRRALRAAGAVALPQAPARCLRGRLRP